jgi:hypothetical protein
MRTFNGQLDPHGWLADDAAKAMGTSLNRHSQVSGWNQYGAGLGGSAPAPPPRVVKAVQRPVYGNDGGLITSTPVRQNQSASALGRQAFDKVGVGVDPNFIRQRENNAAWQAGAGVRPGMAPQMNAVQAARMGQGMNPGMGGSPMPRGIGGSPVGPGMPNMPTSMPMRPMQPMGG